MALNFFLANSALLLWADFIYPMEAGELHDVMPFTPPVQLTPLTSRAVPSTVFTTVPRILCTHLVVCIFNRELLIFLLKLL